MSQRYLEKWCFLAALLLAATSACRDDDDRVEPRSADAASGAGATNNAAAGQKTAGGEPSVVGSPGGSPPEQPLGGSPEQPLGGSPEQPLGGSPEQSLGGSPAPNGGAAAAAGQAGSGPLPHCPFDAAEHGTNEPGELLVDATAPCDQIGRSLVVLGDNLYWLSQRAGRWLLSTGSKRGDDQRILVDSARPILLLDAQAVVAYQIDQRIFVLAGTPLAPLELRSHWLCSALTSTAEYVYCRTVGGEVVRWPGTGGAGSVVFGATGFDLTADPISNTLFYDDNGYVVSRYAVGLRQTGDGVLVAHSLRVQPGARRFQWLVTIDADTLELHSQSVSSQSPLQTVATLRTQTQPVFAPFLGHGVVFAEHAANGSAKISGSRADFDYRSADGVAAMASDPNYVYWLDRKARIYRALPQWRPYPDIEDAFHSSLDDKLVQDLSPAERDTFCDELVAYKDEQVHEADLALARCLLANNAIVFPTVAACEASLLGLNCGGGMKYTRDNCKSGIEAAIGCSLSVAQFAVTDVAYIDRLARLANAASCEAMVDGSWAATSDALAAESASEREAREQRADRCYQE